MNWNPCPNGAGVKKLPAWNSDCGEYRIVDCSSLREAKPFRLISFGVLDDNGNNKFWDFTSLQEAKDFAKQAEQDSVK